MKEEVAGNFDSRYNPSLSFWHWGQVSQPGHVFAEQATVGGGHWCLLDQADKHYCCRRPPALMYHDALVLCLGGEHDNHYYSSEWSILYKTPFI